MKIKKKTILLISFIIIFLIYMAISIRGDYLNLLSIDKKYVEIFNQNIKYKSILILTSFIFIYFSFYITNIFIKKGLSKFFKDDKKTEPKLPNKSIAFVVALVGSILTNNFMFDKLILFLNSAWFRHK